MSMIMDTTKPTVSHEKGKIDRKADKATIDKQKIEIYIPTKARKHLMRGQIEISAL